MSSYRLKVLAREDLAARVTTPGLAEEPEEQTETTTQAAQPPDLETLMTWKAEGYCEATDGCITEPDGTCSHGCNSWLIELGADLVRFSLNVEPLIVTHEVWQARLQ